MSAGKQLLSIETKRGDGAVLDPGEFVQKADRWM